MTRPVSSSASETNMGELQGDNAGLILPFDAVDHTSLPLAGGKAANLGELLRAGLPVPQGFCVTTTAYDLVAKTAGLNPILDRLTETHADDTPRLAELAAAARTGLLGAHVPSAVAEAITRAYRALGDGNPVPVAVRSSATAEDLPYASFAGQ